MKKLLRVLELSQELRVDSDDLIAVCALLDIPANSRISCLADEDVQKLIEYYKNV